MTPTDAQMIERLRNVGVDPLYDWIGPDEAAHIADALERLREIELRVHWLRSRPIDPASESMGARACARFILDEEG